MRCKSAGIGNLCPRIASHLALYATQHVCNASRTRQIAGSSQHAAQHAAQHTGYYTASIAVCIGSIEPSHWEITVIFVSGTLNKVTGTRKGRSQLINARSRSGDDEQKESRTAARYDMTASTRMMMPSVSNELDAVLIQIGCPPDGPVHRALAKAGLVNFASLQVIDRNQISALTYDDPSSGGDGTETSLNMFGYSIISKLHSWIRARTILDETAFREDQFNLNRFNVFVANGAVIPLPTAPPAPAAVSAHTQADKDNQALEEIRKIGKQPPTEDCFEELTLDWDDDDGLSTLSFTLDSSVATTTNDNSNDNNTGNNGDGGSGKRNDALRGGGGGTDEEVLSASSFPWHSSVTATANGNSNNNNTDNSADGGPAKRNDALRGGGDGGGDKDTLSASSFPLYSHVATSSDNSNNNTDNADGGSGERNDIATAVPPLALTSAASNCSIGGDDVTNEEGIRRKGVLAGPLPPATDGTTTTTTAAAASKSMPTTRDYERDAAAVVAEQLSRLSFDDRNAIQEEVHGISCLAPEETPEMRESALRLLSTELDKIQHESPAYDECQRLYGDASYVNGTDFRLRFLRTERFDAERAAGRLTKFLDFMVEIFGSFVLRRPVRLSDFTDEEIRQFGARGDFQLLPFRDRSGRRIFAVVGNLGDPVIDISSPYRVRFVCCGLG